MKDKNVETQDRTDNEGSENYDQGSIGEYLDPEVDTDALVQGLKRGQLTPNQQEALAGLLVEDEPHQHVMAVRQQTTMYRGALPHPDHFNAYDDKTRETILQMAVDEQKHTHDMQKTGLTGAIDKDKRGQRYGLSIAIGGFITAAVIAPFSTVVAGIIGALDLFGMVALFVAPRVLEGRAAKQQKGDDTNEPSEKDS
ncbi:MULTISPECIES: DUF2335 domain-containing protein [Halomonadaceae]|uniref:DUF2335 domain-containing protein n=2 Tax=Oceanospirillales TaxID=135619 RepID=UPI001C627D1F|nr:MULTISPECIES: DUF2335 domain-containing protein [Halomonas]MCG7591731.1 DUF2335 domain-containing protein [Halomonas sp. McD50-5]MCG7614878.1 DUF2335 domain-containing protein [Halomonas sp. McD50-4]